MRLGVNIDHVATLRQARGERYPDPIEAAFVCAQGGADSITFHLREDRRHIQDHDVYRLRDSTPLPLNFEMAATDEMVAIATKINPASVTLVPEKRKELTTEGGLNLSDKNLLKAIESFHKHNILVSLFIEPDETSVEQAKKMGVQAVEFHTGAFCHKLEKAHATEQKKKLVIALGRVCDLAQQAKLQVHVGHGLNYTNAAYLQWIPSIEEANIGHAIVSRAIFCGLAQAVRDMKSLMNDKQHYPFA